MRRGARRQPDEPATAGGVERQTTPRQEQGRTLAEWTTLGISAAIVLALLGLVTYQAVTRGGRPAAIEVVLQTQAVRHEGDAYYLPVEITNRGDETAADVWVQISLASGAGQRQSAQLLIAFLAGGGTARGTAVFHADPAQGELTVEGISFLEP